jgi:CDP-diacylglycerol--serine O-phosphatidyltransferase
MEEGNKELGPWKYGLAVLMVMLSFLMVIDIEYPSFKSVNWRTRRSLPAVIVTILVVWFSVNNWQWTPAVFFVSYLLYGLVRPWVSRRMRQQIEIELEEPEEERTAAGTVEKLEPEEQARVSAGL